jgi:hypothetical protein
VALSVVVRSGPVRTLVNGTLVARPWRMTPVSGCAVGSQLGLSVRPVLGDHRIVGKTRTRRGRVLSARAVADASGAAVLPRPGTAWPAGHGKAESTDVCRSGGH